MSRRRDVQLLAPEVGRRVDLDHAERDRPVDLGAQALHPLQFLLGRDDVLAGDALRGQLEDGPPAGRHGSAESEQFVFCGERSGNRLAVDGSVAERARRREAERTGLDGLLHEPGHRRDVVGGGGLVAGTALAHRIGAHRAVGDLAADVDREVLLLDHVEVLGVALPAPRDALGERGAGNVLDTLHQADQPVLFARPHRREADAAVACDDGGHAMSARRLQQAVPADLAVVVGVDVDESGRDDLSRCVDRLGRVAFQRRVRPARGDAPRRSCRP